jgi:hypothetical protein
VHALLDRRRADDEEVPRLHEADRRRVVRRQQDATEDVVGDRVGEKLAAHVAAAVDRLIDRCAVGVGEGVRRRRARVFHRFPFWKDCAAAWPGSVLSSPGRSSDSDSPARCAFPTRVSGQCIARPPHSAGHVADLHRLPDSPPSVAGRHPETPARNRPGDCDGATTAGFFHPWRGWNQRSPCGRRRSRPGQAGASARTAPASAVCDLGQGGVPDVHPRRARRSDHRGVGRSLGPRAPLGFPFD